jgi:hypothetical protein
MEIVFASIVALMASSAAVAVNRQDVNHSIIINHRSNNAAMGAVADSL